MTGDAVTATEFDRVKLLHCRRWEARSLEAVRALLVDQKRLKDVATDYGMKPQNVNTLRRRFLAKMEKAKAVKLPTSEFMAAVAPEGVSVLEPFASDIKQLVNHGYSQAQVSEFLRANEVNFTDSELSKFLGVLNENTGSGESKGRRR